MGSPEKDNEVVQQLCEQEQGPLLGNDLRRIVVKEAAQLTVRPLDYSLPHRPPCLPVDLLLSLSLSLSLCVLAWSTAVLPSATPRHHHVS